MDQLWDELVLGVVSTYGLMGWSRHEKHVIDDVASEPQVPSHVDGDRASSSNGAILSEDDIPRLFKLAFEDAPFCLDPGAGNRY